MTDLRYNTITITHKWNDTEILLTVESQLNGQ